MRPALVAAFTLLGAAPAWAADPVEGDWLTSGGSGKVRIGPCRDDAKLLCGHIFWLRNPADAKATDGRNPDPNLRGRPILGMSMLWGFKAAGQGRWRGGRIYDPNTGKTYASKLTASPGGPLKVEGCILGICQAQTWLRQ